jgi:hypothetical protein
LRVVRPTMGCALVDDPVHDRCPLYYLARFDLCSAKRSRGRVGHRAFLGDSRCVAHIRFEDGGKGRLRLQNVAGHRSDCLSVMGQSRRFDDVRATSALPLITDLRRKDRHVRFVPQAEMKEAAN